ncbi:MAG: DUF4118 domain-containing protein, partial [Anaerolineales bacterium]|nr:DUF4118 domain-containing protein [Anaerolineales bacterium]
MNDYRPDPDSLLAAIRRDEARQQRGRLKIFFGMAAGVGKTYAMLQAAQARRTEGSDAVVGWVETHGRAETEFLLAGLEQLPKQQLEYRGAVLEEMDLDAILARSPQLVLVDELAHPMRPARHLKRYQDVLELLDAGIDVYTTVNVQHFESRVDAVRQITGITVHEKVPDSLLDLADEIELIDLPPDALRKRLAEGKVYTAERVEVAANNFFRTGNLTALREMALRLTAEHVDHKLQDYMQAKRIAGPWKSGDRLMVAVSPSPFSEEVTAGEDIIEGVLRLAQQRNATQIVVGKPLQTRFEDWRRGGSLVDRLIRAGSDIDIYVVSGDKAKHRTPLRAPFSLPQFQSTWRDYAGAAIAIGCVTFSLLAAHSVWPWISYQAVGLIELLAVLLVAVYLGRGPALLAALLSAISWNFLFIQPRFTFAISALEDIILFLFYFIIALF